MTEPNRQITLKSRPQSHPTLENFALSTAPTPVPGPAEFLVQNLFLSIEPVTRSYIHENKNHSSPVPLGGVIRSFSAGRVVTSRHPDFTEGMHVVGQFGWQEYALSDGQDVRTVDVSEFPLPLHLGVLGTSGLSAWYGLLHVGRPKAGEVVVVSTAAGSVGSAAGQIANQFGCRTVAIAGSEEKARLCKSAYGFSKAINYKNVPEGIGAAVKRACPHGVDIYFDNVGGATLDAILPQLRPGGRVVICGTIANELSPEKSLGPRVERSLLIARARMEGFVILDHLALFPAGLKDLCGWVRDGRLQYREDILAGLENAPAALLRMLSGQNSGKQLVQLNWPRPR